MLCDFTWFHVILQGSFWFDFMWSCYIMGDYVHDGRLSGEYGRLCACLCACAEISVSACPCISVMQSCKRRMFLRPSTAGKNGLCCLMWRSARIWVCLQLGHLQNSNGLTPLSPLTLLFCTYIVGQIMPYHVVSPCILIPRLVPPSNRHWTTIEPPLDHQWLITN